MGARLPVELPPYLYSAPVYTASRPIKPPPLSEISTESLSLFDADQGRFDDCTPPSSLASTLMDPTPPDPPLPRFTKNAPPLADRVSVLLAAPLSKSGGSRRTPPPPSRVTERVSREAAASARLARRVAAALDSLAAATAAASSPRSDGPSPPSPRDPIIPLVVRSLAEFRKDPEVVYKALLTLTQLAANPPFRARIGACGGIVAVIDVMRIHSLRVDIQSQGCLLLANVAHRTPVNKPMALNAGALMVIVAAMSIHSSAEEVQAWGCLALRNLTKVDRDAVKEPHATAAAVEVIANALERMPHSRTVQMQACVALTNIAALSEVAKARIGAVTAVRVVVDALLRNIASASTTIVALSCLSVLVTDIQNQRRAVSHGVVDALCFALERHIGNAIIVSKASACIRFLSYELSHRMLLGTGNAIVHLIDALNIHCSRNASPRALREMMHALGNTVAGCPANKESAGVCGGVRAATRVLRAYTAPDGGASRQLAVVEDACRLLYALLADCPNNHEGAAENGLLSALLVALRMHATQSSRVAEHGTAVFVVLAQNATLQPEVRRGASDLASIMRRARAAHPDNRVIATQTARLLHELGIGEEDMALAWPSGLGDPWAQQPRQRNDFRAILRCRSTTGCI